MLSRAAKFFSGFYVMVVFVAFGGIASNLGHITRHFVLGAKDMEAAVASIGSTGDRVIVYLATAFLTIGVIGASLVIVSAFVTMTKKFDSYRPSETTIKLSGLALVASTPLAFFARDIDVMTCIASAGYLFVGAAMATDFDKMVPMKKLSVFRSSAGIRFPFFDR